MRLRLRVALAAVPVGFLGYFFVYPLVRLVIASTVDAEAFRTVLTDPRIRTAAVFTVGQAALSTVLTVLAALPLTAVIAHYRFPGRGLVRAWVTVPFVMPSKGADVPLFR